MYQKIWPQLIKKNFNPKLKFYTIIMNTKIKKKNQGRENQILSIIIPIWIFEITRFNSPSTPSPRLRLFFCRTNLPINDEERNCLSWSKSSWAQIWRSRWSRKRKSQHLCWRLLRKLETWNHVRYCYEVRRRRNSDKCLPPPYSNPKISAIRSTNVKI